MTFQDESIYHIFYKVRPYNCVFYHPFRRASLRPRPPSLPIPLVAPSAPSPVSRVSLVVSRYLYLLSFSLLVVVELYYYDPYLILMSSFPFLRG